MTKFKQLMLVFVLFLACVCFPSISFASETSNDILNVDLETDKEAYDDSDVITSTLTITNVSERYSAKDIDIQTKLPDELEVTESDDLDIENGIVYWDVNDLEQGEALEVTFTSKLKDSVQQQLAGESTEEENTSGTSGDSETAVENNNDQSITKDEKNDQTVTETAAPQTGDNVNLFTYMVILLISVILGIIAFIGIRKKKIPKTATFIIAILLLTPFASHIQAVESEKITQESTYQHTLSIGDNEYDVETSVTTTIVESLEQIPVTGTIYDAEGNLLTNHELTFETTIDNEQITNVIETDDEGYFVERLYKNIDYQVTSDDIQASMTAVDVNEVEVTNELGEIELGKSLRNGDNHSFLQPSVIYLDDEDVESINDISSDLSQATFTDSLDLMEDDLIVVPEWEEYPSGIAFQIESIDRNDSEMILELEQPEIEDIFEEIVGEIEVDMSPGYFTPADGVEIQDVMGATTEESIELDDQSIGSKLTLKIDDLIEYEEFSLNGKVELSGKFSGDIDWRVGLNPVNSFDFNFTGEQNIIADATVVSEKEVKVPLGKLVVPTQVPGLTVSVPFELVTKVSGEVSVEISTGIRENIGLSYTGDEGVRTYPEEHFEPYFQMTDVNGSGELAAGVGLSVFTQGFGIDLLGATGTGMLTGKATTSVIGQNLPYSCLQLSRSFDAELKLKAPILNGWESPSINADHTFPGDEIGNCVRSINVNPNQLEMEPDETKSVTVSAINNTGESPINNDDDLEVVISDSDLISVEKRDNRVDIQSSEHAQDGDEIEIEFNYELNGTTHTDTLKVQIKDDRPKGELVGSVIDAVEETPLHNANVELFRDGQLVQTVETLEDGTYQVNVAPGQYKVEVSYPGYIKDSSIVTIQSEDSTTYDSVLYLVGDEYGGNGKVSGVITNAVTGDGVQEVNIDIRRGKNTTEGEVIKTIKTAEDGSYEVELPGGNYTMTLEADGFISTNANILSIGGEEKSEQNATISPSGLLAEDLRVVLTWGENPRDLDSHITGPREDGGRFHVYYSAKEYIDSVNNVNLDRDDIHSYGPETITVIKQLQQGTYTYAVHNYTGRYLTEDNQFDLSNSEATVRIYKGDQLLETYNVPVNQPGNSWRVFEIRDGEIVQINQVETIDNWRSPDYFAPLP
ncbi:carboxypeptidase regulatory-like domain-containing protein [Gracilibacillus sp. S3-1-1]|uniref:Carboxypeptidase regulatory-like domain-containing protein n=1 Tax=Gracilibacillus pellucidus TaxID=3095368 RepID=A0ACC6M3P2_9BACI|nr:carboxypeptidase regulatory-like domain-containing protein [Gracilibacillus sp. S3-1-1]MDX8045580.1 carboxypeptidase regulatory-like domain-containing protein [Gracilibacillus sp. S3-1-1]